MDHQKGPPAGTAATPSDVWRLASCSNTPQRSLAMYQRRFHDPAGRDRPLDTVKLAKAQLRVVPPRSRRHHLSLPNRLIAWRACRPAGESRNRDDKGQKERKQLKRGVRGTGLKKDPVLLDCPFLARTCSDSRKGPVVPLTDGRIRSGFSQKELPIDQGTVEKTIWTVFSGYDDVEKIWKPHARDGPGEQVHVEVLYRAQYGNR